MSLEGNKAIVARLVEELVNQGDMGVVDELFSPEFVNHNPGFGSSPDREGIKQGLETMRKALPDLHVMVEDAVAEGEKVAERSMIRGTHLGELMGIAPTGREVTMTDITILRIVDGKVVERWSEGDSLGLLQQLGAIALPGLDED